MNCYPESIKRLIESFKLLSGIGEKTAERLVYNIMNMDLENVEMFSKSLLDVKTKIKKCEVCHNLTEENKCLVCLDDNRLRKICVVETPKNIMLLEKSGIYNGKYHSLDGLISPIDGIGIDDINIDSLIKRIENENIEELIFALKPGIEGDTTLMYISRLVSNLGVKTSKLSQGLPMGADMDYVDNLTLEMAMKDRKIIE